MIRKIDLERRMKRYLNGAMLEAIIKDDDECVLEFLRMGCDPNFSEDKEHVTALHYAVTYKSYYVLKTLLENGACTLERDGDGRTPLDCAIEINEINMINELKKVRSKK